MEYITYFVGPQLCVLKTIKLKFFMRICLVFQLNGTGISQQQMVACNATVRMGPLIDKYYPNNEREGCSEEIDGSEEKL